MPHSNIEAIKANNPKNVKQCLKEVVNGWLKMKGSEAPSWINLCKALRDPLVKREDVALDIERLKISNFTN